MTGLPPRRERVVIAAELYRVRQRVLSALESCGVDCFVHKSGRDVLDFALWGDPALIFLGLTDPAQSLRLYAALRGHAELAACAVIVLAADTPRWSLPGATDGGHDRLLAQEPEATELRELAIRHFQRRRAAAA